VLADDVALARMKDPYFIALAVPMKSAEVTTMGGARSPNRPCGSSAAYS
jgi:hypothetical protein